MKLSLSWIRDYVDLPADLEIKKLAYELTMDTVEVEGVENLAASFNSRVSAANDEVLRLGAQVATLEDELTAYRSYEQLSLSLAKEAEPIFPQVRTIDVARTKDGTVAIVTLRKGSSLNAADRQKMRQWLTARTALENLDMIVR